MAIVAEIGRSLRGAWLVFLGRHDALGQFNLTREGFWRSFAAFLLALPFYLVTIGFEAGLPVSVPGGIILAADGGGDWGARLASYALSWVALPALLWLVARPLGVGATYRQFVIVRNWASVLVAVAYAVLAPIRAAGGAGAEIGEILALALLFLVVRFVFMAARRALDASVPLALGIVVASLVLGWIIDAATGALIPF